MARAEAFVGKYLWPSLRSIWSPLHEAAVSLVPGISVGSQGLDRTACWAEGRGIPALGKSRGLGLYSKGPVNGLREVMRAEESGPLPLKSWLSAIKNKSFFEIIKITSREAARKIW